MDLDNCTRFSRQMKVHRTDGMIDDISDGAEDLPADEDSDPLMFLIHQEEKLIQAKPTLSLRELKSLLDQAIINNL